MEVEDGICSYEFPKPLRLKLYNPKRSTPELNLHLQNQFKSRHALVLWEVCFDYFDADRDQGETPFSPLEMFRELLGIKSDDFPAFSTDSDRAVIKSASKQINEVTDYFVEAEHKRIGPKVSHLKFRITRVQNSIHVLQSFFPDIENLPPVAVELIEAEIDRQVAMKIADEDWDFVNPEKLPEPGTYPNFLVYVAEKIEISRHAAEVKNRGGFIIEAIRENYQNSEVQKARALRAEKVRAKELQELTEEFKIKQQNILRQAVHADPELVERAAEHIHSYIVRERLLEHDSALAAYQKGGMVTAEINAILAAEFCQEMLAPVVAAYQDERGRILGG